MDWFITAVNGISEASVPVWVAFFTLIGTAVTAAGMIWRERIGKRSASEDPSEVAIATLDSRSVMSVASALEALNLTQIEQNRNADELLGVLKRLAGEVEELRRELRAQGDALRNK